VKKLLLIALLAWVLIPTGTPDDLLTLPLIGLIGLPLYSLIILSLIAYLVYNHISLRGMRQELKQSSKRLYRGRKQ